MKRFKISLILFVYLSFPASLLAHQKVVVIPMGSPDIVGVYSQPYQYSSTDFIDITNSGTTVLAAGESTDVVPDGKRLFVQNLSYKMSSVGIDGGPLCTARVLSESTEIVTHPVLMTKSMYGTTEVFTANVSLMMYADPGMKVGISCWVRVTNDVREHLGVSGYYIDL